MSKMFNWLRKKFYKRLPDNSGQEGEIGPIAANSLNNPYGFDDTRWLKIVNCLDSTVIELTIENKLVTRPEDPARTDFQTFQCLSKDGGHFEIKSKHQSLSPESESIMVWDYLPHDKLLIQRKQNRAAKRSNQSWTSEVVPAPGTVTNHFIISAPEYEKCLRNMGVDNQIKVVPKTDEIIGDKAAHWKIVMLEPISKS